MKPVLFISCASDDRADLRKLRAALTPIVLMYDHELFDADSLKPGTDIESETARHRARAGIILLLVTSSYLGSAECQAELRAVSGRLAQAATLIPILWRAVSRESLPPELAKLQMLPRSGEAVCTAANVDKALAEFVDEIARTLAAQKPADTDSNSSSPVGMPTLSAGQYMSLHRTALKAMAQLERIGVQLYQKSATARAKQIRQALQQDLYRVVVTGKSRAGKSTLLNALIGRALCPSQEELTTAVPIIIGPGERELAQITFADAREPLTLDGPIDAEKLQPYADQEKNQENQHRVKEIVVTLGGPLLELGVVYMDIPGFDDPNQSIQSAATRAIETAHALIVVVDVSPRAHGGFTLDQATLNYLQAGLHRKCKLFIVGNKADVLTTEHRQAVEKDIRNRLTRAVPALATEPIYLLSAAEACESSGKDPPFRRFFEALWQELWRTDGIGLHRLHRVFDGLMQGSEEVAALFAALEAKEEERARLKAAVNRCAEQCQQLKERCTALQTEDQAQLVVLIKQAESDLRQYIITAVESIQPGQELPRPSQVLSQLKGEIERVHRNIHDAVATRASGHQREIEKEVEGRLMELRMQAGLPPGVMQMQQQLLEWSKSMAGLDNYDPSQESVILAGTLSALLGATLMVVNPLLGGVLGGVLATIGSAVTKHLVDRATTKEALTKKCGDHLAGQLKERRATLSNALEQFYQSLRELVDDLMQPFISDMRQKLAAIRSPTEEERTLCDDLTKQSRQALDSLRRVSIGSARSPSEDRAVP